MLLHLLLQSFEEPEFDLAVGAGLPSRQEIVQILMRIINQSTSYPGDKGTFTVRGREGGCDGVRVGGV